MWAGCFPGITAGKHSGSPRKGVRAKKGWVATGGGLGRQNCASGLLTGSLAAAAARATRVALRPYIVVEAGGPAQATPPRCGLFNGSPSPPPARLAGLDLNPSRIAHARGADRLSGLRLMHHRRRRRSMAV